MRIGIAFVLCLLPLSSPAVEPNQYGQYDGLCPALHAHDSLGQAVVVSQYRFENGTFDLGMSRNQLTTNGEPSPVIRLSLKGSKEPKCHFPSFTVKQGGDWGWHVAWSSSHHIGVYYARVDGQMWVSSPPKKMNTLITDRLELSVTKDLLVLRSGNQQGTGQREQVVTSNDEGRNWSKLEDQSLEATE